MHAILRHAVRSRTQAMITLEDCIAMCGLTEQEVLAIAEHEHIPEIAAAARRNTCSARSTAPKGSAKSCGTIFAPRSPAVTVSMHARCSWRYDTFCRRILARALFCRPEFEVYRF